MNHFIRGLDHYLNFILNAMPWFSFFLFKINFITTFKFSFFRRGRNSRDAQFFSSSEIVSDFASTNSKDLSPTGHLNYCRDPVPQSRY